MQTVDRRAALKRIAAVSAGALVGGRLAAAMAEATTPMAPRPRIPLVHITDLYHPPQDPDDHIDLATIVGLAEYEVRGVVLDITQKFLVAAPAGWDLAREPGFIAVNQLAQFAGRKISAAMGPTVPLANPADPATDRPRAEQAGITLLLETLAGSREPVAISVVGSARSLAAAFNREPDLVRRQTRVVLLNAGSTGGPKREWNVALDPAAYVALWRSGLPLHWFPCATERGAFDPEPERGTFWKARQSVLFADLPSPLRAWFGYAFSGAQHGDLARALVENASGAGWEKILAGERNLWATASLVLGAGRVLARMPAGWRFVPAGKAGGAEVWPWRLDPIQATVNDDARVDWRVVAEPASTRLFGRRAGVAYGLAMAEALNALLRAIPV